MIGGPFNLSYIKGSSDDEDSSWSTRLSHSSCNHTFFALCHFSDHGSGEGVFVSLALYF